MCFFWVQVRVYSELAYTHIQYTKQEFNSKIVHVHFLLSYNHYGVGGVGFTLLHLVMQNTKKNNNFSIICVPFYMFYTALTANCIHLFTNKG